MSRPPPRTYSRPSRVRRGDVCYLRVRHTGEGLMLDNKTPAVAVQLVNRAGFAESGGVYYVPETMLISAVDAMKAVRGC